MPTSDRTAREVLARDRIMRVAAVMMWVVPCAAVAWANAVFTFNHFYVSGAYIHDSGWFSHTVFRQGVFPANPAIAEARPSYFSLHVSGLVALGSVLSYLFPGDRVDWYCLFQGAIYAPLGAAVAALVANAKRAWTLPACAGVTAVGLAFAFNGQAAACMGYPHFEISIAAGICLMLAGLATEKSRLAWAGLALAIGTREDGGAHAATFLVAILACDLLGRPFPVTRKRIVQMTVVAALATLTLMVLQKTVFHGAALFREEYIGEPAFAHITWHTLRERFGWLLDQSLFVLLPLGATVAIAIVDRDPRWFLGWAVALPWFALNFLARQRLKVTFDIYTGFPFVGSIFWVGVYARVKYGAAAVLPQLLGRLVVVSVLSTIGLYWCYAPFERYLASAMLRPQPVDGVALRTYARSIRANRYVYGHILVDPSMASWTTESLDASSLLHSPTDADHGGLVAYDGFTFFRPGLFGAAVHSTLANAHFSNCGELPGTPAIFCGRQGTALPPNFRPIPFLMQSLWLHPMAKRTDAGIAVPATPQREVAIFGPYMRLRFGHYRAVLTIAAEPCLPRPTADIYARGRVLTTATLEENATSITLEADVAPPSALEGVELRMLSGACAYTLENIDLSVP